MKNKKVFWIIVLFIIILTIGLSIYILKNNKENDWLTFTFANKNDIWLHTKIIFSKCS